MDYSQPSSHTTTVGSSSYLVTIFSELTTHNRPRTQTVGSSFANRALVFPAALGIALFVAQQQQTAADEGGGGGGGGGGGFRFLAGFNVAISMWSTLFLEARGGVCVVIVALFDSFG